MNNWFKFCIYSFLFWITHGCIIQKRMYILIGPRNGQKLLPPSWSHVWYIKTQNKWQWDEIQECIEVLDNLFKQPEIKKKKIVKSKVILFFVKLKNKFLKNDLKKENILDSAVKSWNSISKKCICHRYMRKMQNIAIFWGLEREDHFLEIRGFYLMKLSRVKWFKIYHIFGD